MMEKLKKVLRSPVTTVLLFVLAAALLITSTVGGTRAALTYYSETYSSRVEMFDIGVSLLENGSRLSWRDYASQADGTWNETKGPLFEHLLAEGESFQLGRVYNEELSVRNSGNIDHYLRVNIYKYWVDANGEKLRDLSPDYINLHLCNLNSDWLLDESSSTEERTVLYYNKILGAGETTPLFADWFSVTSAVGANVTQKTSYSNGYTIIETVYDYNGVKFQVEVEVDAVQTHNAEDAILSAWGRHVTISGNSLRLAD